MRVREGDAVRKGQLLALLDARDAESQRAAAQAAVEEAEAALAEARGAYRAALEMRTAAKASADLAGQTFERYRKLYESRSVSPQEIDEVRARRDAGAAELASRESMAAAAEERIRQVEARLIQAKAQRGRADVLIGWTRIEAPSDGKIVERTADAGTAVFPGTPLLVIESVARPQVLADIPTEFAGRLHVGMGVLVHTGAAEERIAARVSEIVPRSNPATHSVRFKADLPSDTRLPNGLFVRVDVPDGTRDALLVPRAAVRETGQLTGLFVVDGSSKARFRLIKCASYDAERLEVLSGVEPGESIVSPLNDSIVEGTSVEIRP
jgi:multidrug efflux pump subunit AcrA (membrane-fusion protein)